MVRIFVALNLTNLSTTEQGLAIHYSYSGLCHHNSDAEIGTTDRFVKFPIVVVITRLQETSI